MTFPKVYFNILFTFTHVHLLTTVLWLDEAVGLVCSGGNMPVDADWEQGQAGIMTDMRAAAAPHKLTTAHCY